MANYMINQVSQTPPPAPSPKPTYIPEPSVVDRNNLFVYALKSAPGVLMEQYKHFGQVCLVSSIISIDMLTWFGLSLVYLAGAQNLVN